MKKILCLCAVALAAVTVLSEITPEKRARIMERRRARLAEAGGLVQKPHAGNFARVVSAQSRVDLAFIKDVVAQFNSGLNIWIEVNELAPAATPFETVQAALKLPKTGVALVIVEDPKLPTILSAMENGWALLNVTPLDSDMPPKAVYDQRVRKEINRAFAQAFGAGLSLNGPCVMEPAYSLAALDAIKFPVISPEVMSKIVTAGAARAIPPIRVATYREAARQGWAPAPTNDVQRAILETVNSEKERGPAKGLKIVPKAAVVRPATKPAAPTVKPAAKPATAPASAPAATPAKP